MIWTDEAVAELKKMWDRGMTTGQIAKALNVTKNSIIGKVHRLCLTARPSPIKKAPEEKAEKKSDKATKSEKKSKTMPTAEIQEPAVLNVKTSKESTATNSVEETNIPLVKLDNHTCRWPLGDPRDDDFCFCGKKIRTGQTYCDEHAAIAYVKPGKKM